MNNHKYKAIQFNEGACMCFLFFFSCFYIKGGSSLIMTTVVETHPVHIKPSNLSTISVFLFNLVQSQLAGVWKA